MRQQLNRTGHGRCEGCGGGHPANQLQVDHIRPLVDGGTDTDPNVRPLCRACHTQATSAQARARAVQRRAGRRSA
ncbi:HNH endonuclease [Crossiella sp. CA198]|uniref:HNH endonuclease n=1 Tax=Crossiella sp. CA198 TaxID=3455607 RepID=UPI003F8D5BE0